MKKNKTNKKQTKILKFYGLIGKSLCICAGAIIGFFIGGFIGLILGTFAGIFAGHILEKETLKTSF